MSVTIQRKLNGQFRKGAPSWNHGKKCTEEERARLGKLRLGIPQSKEHRDRISQAKMGHRSGMKGKHHSVESIFKIKSKINKQLSSKGGIISVTKQQRSKEPNTIEKKVYDELKSRGLLFETQKLINGKFLVDAYIPKLNLVIEVDGTYWHSLDRVVKKDKAENAYLKKCGYKLIRLNEPQIRNGEFVNLMGI